MRTISHLICGIGIEEWMGSDGKKVLEQCLKDVLKEIGGTLEYGVKGIREPMRQDSCHPTNVRELYEGKSDWPFPRGHDFHEYYDYPSSWFYFLLTKKD